MLGRELRRSGKTGSEQNRLVISATARGSDVGAAAVQGFVGIRESEDISRSFHDLQGRWGSFMVLLLRIVVRSGSGGWGLKDHPRVTAGCASQQIAD
jgi:hypothetical protein